MLKSSAILLSIVLLFICCSSPEAIKTVNSFSLEQFKQKDLLLSSIASSIEYVKLETTSESLIKDGQVKLFGDKIFVRNGSPSGILIFDRDGVYQNKISRKGKGPGEYLRIFSWDVSPNLSSVVINDMMSRKIHVYTTDGEIITAVKYDGTVNDVFFLDNERIVFNKICPEELSDYPILQSYNIKSGVRDTLLKTTYKRPKNYPQNNFGLMSYLHRFERELFITILNNDTLFRINQKQELSPYLVISSQDYSDPHENMKWIPHTFFQSSEHVFFLTDAGNPKLHGINKMNSDFFTFPRGSHCLLPKAPVLGPVNDLDFIDPVFFFSSRQSQHWCSLLEIIDLRTMLEHGCISKKDLSSNPNLMKLQELYKSSEENDNPIVRIVHLQR